MHIWKWSALRFPSPVVRRPSEKKRSVPLWNFNGETHFMIPVVSWILISTPHGPLVNNRIVQIARNINTWEHACFVFQLYMSRYHVHHNSMLNIGGTWMHIAPQEIIANCWMHFLPKKLQFANVFVTTPRKQLVKKGKWKKTSLLDNDSTYSNEHVLRQSVHKQLQFGFSLFFVCLLLFFGFFFWRNSSEKKSRPKKLHRVHPCATSDFFVFPLSPLFVETCRILILYEAGTLYTSKL